MTPADRETLKTWIVFCIAACAVLALIAFATGCTTPIDKRDPVVLSGRQPIDYPRPSQYPK